MTNVRTAHVRKMKCVPTLQGLTLVFVLLALSILDQGVQVWQETALVVIVTRALFIECKDSQKSESKY